MDKSLDRLNPPFGFCRYQTADHGQWQGRLDNCNVLGQKEERGDRSMRMAAPHEIGLDRAAVM